MSILSGSEIRRQVELGRILIDPYDPRQLNQVSYDVRLGEAIVMVQTNHAHDVNYQHPNAHDGTPFTLPLGHMRRVDVIDSKKQCSLVVVPRDPEAGYLLEPGRLYLGHTAERIRTDHFVPTIDGKSSIGRFGVFIHVTAGYGEPGFDGQWTLEIVVTLPTILYPGMRIGQMRFTTIEGEVELYRGNYTGKYSQGPVPSRAWRQFEQDSEVKP